jgi:hypothetical protein
MSNVKCDQLLFGASATANSALTRFGLVQILPSSKLPPNAPPLGPIIIGGTASKWGAIRAAWAENDGHDIYLNDLYFPNDTAANVSTPWGASLSAVDVFNHINNTAFSGLQVEEAVVLHELWHIGAKTPASVIDSAAGEANLIATCFPNN